MSETTTKKNETVADESMITAAAAFISEKVTQSGDNVFAVRGTDLKKFIKEQGVPTEMQNRIASLNDALLAAAIDFNGKKLIENIEKKKKAGEDAEEGTVVTNLNFHDGRLQVSMDPKVSRKIPMHLPSMQGRPVEGDGFTHHFAAVTVKKNTKTPLSSRAAQLADWEEKAKKALGL